MPFHKTHTPGELIERVDGDVTTLAEFFSQMVVKVAGNALLVVAILGLLYRENAVGGAASPSTRCSSSPRWRCRPDRRAGVDGGAGGVGRANGLPRRTFAGFEDIRGVGAEAHAQAPARPSSR